MTRYGLRSQAKRPRNPASITVDEQALQTQATSGRVRSAPKLEWADLDERHALTLDAIDEFEPAYLAAMREPASFGPAKSLVDQMLSDGVELTDERAVQAWIEALNARPYEERVEILGPPVGHGGITLESALISSSSLPGGTLSNGKRHRH